MSLSAPIVAPPRLTEATRTALSGRTGVARAALLALPIRAPDELSRRPVPSVYTGSALLLGATVLLRVDLRIDGIREAVRLSPAVPTDPGDPLVARVLTVDWEPVLRRTRGRGVRVLASLARSMLEGRAMDLSRLTELDRHHRGVVADCFELIARPDGRG